MIQKMPLLKAYNILKNEEFMLDTPIFVGYLKEEVIPKTINKFGLVSERATFNSKFAGDEVVEVQSYIEITIYFTDKTENVMESVNDIRYKMIEAYKKENKRNAETKYKLMETLVDYDINLNLPRIIFTYLYTEHLI